MTVALPWILLTALLVHTSAHVVLAIRLARAQGWQRALVALIVPPLAPYWGWRARMYVPVWIWGVALAVYALGVAAA